MNTGTNLLGTLLWHEQSLTCTQIQILHFEAFNSKTSMSNARSKHALQFYQHTGALPTVGSYYGTSDMPVYYSSVGCSSGDATIDQCYSSLTSTCGSANYAGVVCGGKQWKNLLLTGN